MKPRDSYLRTNKNKLLSPSAKVFSAKMFGRVDPPKFLTAKVLCYTVSRYRSIFDDFLSLGGGQEIIFCIAIYGLQAIH